MPSFEYIPPMGIDYVLDLDCAPKHALTTEGIIRLDKARNRGQWILERARRSGDLRSPSELTFGVQVNRMGTIESVEVTVQSLFDQAAVLDEHRAACASCPANRGNPTGYGCYQFINYPIEPDTEKLLLSRLPDELESAAGYMLASAFRDFTWEGTHAARMRGQGETFFRLRTSPSRSWPALTVSADQIFHMMFHVGNLQPSHSMMVCLFFGLIAVTEEDDARSLDTELESTSARQMVAFLNTLAFAAKNELDVVIDA